MGIPIALRSGDTRDVIMTSFVRGGDGAQGEKSNILTSEFYTKIL